MRDQDTTVLVNFDSKEEAAGLLEQAYTELGKAYYEGGFEDPLPQLLPLFDRITSLKNRLEQEAAPAPQPEPVPPVPEEVHPAPQPEPVPPVPEEVQPAPVPDEVYPEPAWEPVPEERQPEPQPAPAFRPGQPRFCIYCGSRLEPGDLFCSNCGHRIR
ncbi:MAG TPA: zinc ribbon domain-containing protein [Candidatus Mediterraneibacter norwichensis]|nr:zinc ribbon domain-containing protein [Candidatus Mediterraneibacter norwichensis]